MWRECARARPTGIWRPALHRYLRTGGLAGVVVLVFAAGALAAGKPTNVGVTGKDANALNEVELIRDSLMNNDGVLRANNVIKYIPEQSVVKLNIGDQVHLTADEFERLAAAFFTGLERKFL